MKLEVVFTAEQVEALTNAFEAKAPAAEKTENFWDEIEFFKPIEFRCKCSGKYCNGDTAEAKESLVRALDGLRKTAGKPIIISSGVRCPVHNSNVGGVYNSWHLTGNAADFTITGMTAAAAMALVKQCGIKCREMYAIDGNYVHITVKE